MNPDSPVNPSTPADIPARADTEVRLEIKQRKILSIYTSKNFINTHKHRIKVQLTQI